MKKLLFLVFAVALSISFILAFGFYNFCVTPPSQPLSSVIVNIPQGSSLKKISRILEKKNVIEGSFKFMLLARLKNVEHNIKSGEYSITGSMSPAQILDKLTRGEVITHAVTIPEGSTIFDVARITEQAGYGPADLILQKANDAAFAKTLGIEYESLEGFLFPDTYRFSKGTGPDVILGRMVARFKEVFSPVRKSWFAETDLSEKDLITLASLVEKETALHSEKPLIAAVFLNRLKKRMRLECDPTVVYGLRLENPEFRSRLRKKHLLKKTPYNTYQIFGLPPGPICNPGLESIKAVLRPARGINYLYFVSMNNGAHKFSNTLKEHNRAVARYQKRLR